MFWQKRKELNSVEYDYVLKRLAEVQARVDYLEASFDNMRNLARKIQKAKQAKEEAVETEDLNPSNVLIPT